jgi:hypothetical protein
MPLTDEALHVLVGSMFCFLFILANDVRQAYYWDI